MGTICGVLSLLCSPPEETDCVHLSWVIRVLSPIFDRCAGGVAGKKERFIYLPATLLEKVYLEHPLLSTEDKSVETE